jgi:peptide/nickel transport system substrate-binding protein/oligopeptide transport system substrate-binding protein
MTRERMILGQTHEGLLRPDPASGNPTPALAEDWSVDQDQRRYLFHLRRGIRFHDGRPLTAADVVYSLSRHFDPAVASTIYSFLRVIAGGVERMEGRAASVSGLRAVDPLTVEIVLEQPSAVFPHVLGMAAAGIVPEGASIPEHASPPGTGPFLFESWEQGRQIRLAAYTDYREGAPRLAGVTFRIVTDEATAWELYGRGEIDVLDSAPSGKRRELEAAADGQLRTFPALGLVALGVNLDRPPLGTNALLRRALSAAIDRDYVCRVTNEGKDRPASQILPPEIPGHDPTIRARFDLAAAGRLLAQAGYPGGSGLAPLSVAYPLSDTVTKNVLARIQDDLRTVGVSLEPVAMDFAVFTEMLEKGGPAIAGFDLYRVAWEADYPDADAYFTPLLDSGAIGPGGVNTSYREPEVDRMLAAARQGADPTRRAEIYAEVSRRASDALPFIPIYWRGDDLVAAPRVEGLVLGPLGETMVPMARVGLRLPPA